MSIKIVNILEERLREIAGRLAELSNVISETSALVTAVAKNLAET